MDNNKFKCPIESLSNILGKKWVFNIIWFLREDKKRFSEIQKYLEGCSRKVLSQQLDLLIENNIVINEKQEINNNLESYYYLSSNGLELLDIIERILGEITLFFLHMLYFHLHFLSLHYLLNN